MKWLMRDIKLVFQQRVQLVTGFRVQLEINTELGLLCAIVVLGDTAIALNTNITCKIATSIYLLNRPISGIVSCSVLITHRNS